MHDQWHKIVALLLFRSGEKEAFISLEEIMRMTAMEECVVVIHEKRDGLHLSLVSAKEARRLAKEEGGLPV
jgi:hypothetical protein